MTDLTGGTASELQPRVVSAAGTTTAPPTGPPRVTPNGNDHDEQPPLEVDDAAVPADDDSANEDQLSSYTASLTSSVIDYPIENGRRYHAYRAGSYFMPNDQNEMDRLDYAHLVTTKILGDKLYVAPIEEKNIHQVLDIGTGTGLWAIDFADRFPAAEVHGIDLSAIQPEWAPPNVKFEIDDVESPWVDRTYDFINCHWMMGSIQDWPKLISNCYKNLNPGGWAEFLEMGGEYSSDDGSFTHDHATYKWIKTLFDGIASTGRDSRPGTKLKGWVENAGFENITYKKVKVPLGVWPKDPYYKEMGFLNLTNLLDGLEAFTLRIFCGVLGFTKEETMLQLAEVRKELKDKRSFNAYYEVHIVCGQKPAGNAE